MSGMTGAVAEAVGMGLLHFTWMGLLLGAGMEVLLTLLRGQSPRLRYGVALSGFALLALVPALTIGMRMASIEIPKETPQESLAYVLPSVNFEDSQLPIVKPTTGGPILYVDPPATPIPMLEVRPDYMNPVFELPLLKDSPVVTLEVAEEDATLAPPANGALAGFAGRLRASLESRAEAVAPWLTVGWIAGVLLLGLRLLGGLHYTRKLKTDGARALETRWQARVTQLCESARLRKGVRVVQSTLTKVPVVVGWFSPVVLMPVALFTGLPPKQVELLLAHELAHIKRLDPLVNLFQVVVETLLFFHPVIWRLSRRIRDERELCCDDIALAICGGRAEYAQALLHIAERTVSEPPLALAAGGGRLQQRINRILGRPVGRDRLSTPGALGLLVLTLCGAFMTGLAWAEFSRENTTQPQMSALQMENYVVVPTDAARNQLFNTEPGELWLAPYYELPALDLKLETYDGSTPEAPAPAAEPTRDSTTTLTEDTVTVPAVVDPVEVIEAPERVAVAEAAESTPESIPEKLPTPILDEEESAETQATRAEEPQPVVLSQETQTTEGAPTEAVSEPVVLARAEDESDVELSQGPSTDEAIAAEGVSASDSIPANVKNIITGRFLRIGETIHLEDVVRMLLPPTGLRVKLDGNAIAPKDSPPEIASRFESNGILTIEQAFLENFADAVVFSTDLENNRSVEIPLYRLDAKSFAQSVEDGLDALLTPLGLTYHVYPGTIVITTPSRLAEVIAQFSPPLYDVSVRYYKVSDPELTARLEKAPRGGNSMSVTVLDDLRLAQNGAQWKDLEENGGATLLTAHAFQALDASLWWYETPPAAKSAGKRHRLFSAAASHVPHYRDTGCCGCGMRDSVHGGPGVLGGLGTQTEVGYVLDSSWSYEERQNLLLYHQLFDLARPDSAPRGRRGGRRIDKGPGQDRPKATALEENSGIITGVSIAANGDPDAPFVQLYIQENLNHWDLEHKGEWRTIRGAGRLGEPVAYAWPTDVEGTYAVAVVSVEPQEGA